VSVLNRTVRANAELAAVFDCTPLKANLFVQDDTEEGIVDLNLAVVLDKAQFPEFVHGKIDPGDRVVPIISASISCDTFGSAL
jgi:hypothetical protein